MNCGASTLVGRNNDGTMTVEGGGGVGKKRRSNADMCERPLTLAAGQSLETPN